MTSWKTGAAIPIIDINMRMEWAGQALTVFLVLGYLLYGFGISISPSLVLVDEGDAIRPFTRYEPI